MIKFSQEYNHEVDMYGDIVKAGEVDLRVLDFGIPIPVKFLADQSNMKTIRSMMRFNPDIPGAIELVHPNKFLPNLRPVEDFRHTPLIPISEKELLDHKRKIEERNRQGYYVEIRKDTIYFYTITMLGFAIVLYVFVMVNETQIRYRTEMERSLVLKRKATTGREGLSRVVEREAENLNKKIF